VIIHILSSGDIEGGRVRAVFVDPAAARVALRALYRRERPDPCMRRWRRRHLSVDDLPSLVDDGQVARWADDFEWWEVRPVRVQ
jgi:hypothetical protein